MGRFNLNQDAAPTDPEDILKHSHGGEADVTDVKQAEALLLEAEAATEQEHQMGIWQALKTYPHASAWSIFISFAVVMEGMWNGFGACPTLTVR